MTAAALQPNRTASRVIPVVRLHFVNRMTTVWTPLLVLAAILLVNIAVWALILANTGPDDRADVAQGLQYSGASFWIFVYMMVVAIQAMNLTFPFAQGFSTTRRDYYLGTILAFLIYSVGYGAILTLLSLIEDWTGGWGLGGRMFTAVYFGGGEWFQRLFVFAGGLLFFFMVGVAFGTVYVRAKARGLIAFSLALAVVVLGAAFLISVTGSWPAVGAWFVSAQAPGVVAVLLIPAALAGIAGFFILRGATPKS